MVRHARAHGAREPAPAARARALRLVFAGTPAAALPALTALLDSRHEVAAVLTRPDAPAGRGRTLRPSPVRELAEARGIAVLTPRSPREEGFLDSLRGLRPDCCPVVAYGALVPRPLLDVPPRGWVNLHFSLLPAWRGAAPVQHALLAGDEVTGASAFLLEEGLDTGPVLGVLTEQIHPEDTSGTLLARLADAGAGLLVAALDGLQDGGLQPVPQSQDGVSLAPKLTTADARIDWSAPALRVDRLVRACSPAPGAWTTLRGKRIGIGPVTPADQAARLAPGELSGALVGTATGAVRLGEVRPEGRAAMPAADWLRGVRPVEGERLA